VRILIVDNNIEPDYWGGADFRRFASLMPGATFYVRRAPHDDLPKSPRGFDKVILSGSLTSAMEDAPWISRLHQFSTETVHAGIPLLGVCYGHQTLARVVSDWAGEKTVQVCRKAKVPEIGWTEIHLTGESKLFTGLPETFYSFSTHYDEVGTLPGQLKKIAHSKDCAIQGFQLEDKPVFGIQFHPEKGIPSAEKCFREKRECPKSKNDPLLHPDKSKQLFDESVGKIIFMNFFNL
jgi:GMP synthase (glutamine-hydrolysing)